MITENFKNTAVVIAFLLGIFFSGLYIFNETTVGKGFLNNVSVKKSQLLENNDVISKTELDKIVQLRSTMSSENQKLLDSAEAGILDAQTHLAYRYLTGTEGMGVNLVAAAFWYTEAAAQGDAISMRNLSNMYFSGDGVVKNGLKGLYFSNLAHRKQACDNGDKAMCVSYKRITE